MKPKEKISFIIKTLDDLYPNPEIPLFHLNPFTLLVAVLLSAQCQDARVNLVTPQLFNLAKDPYEMSKLDESTIYEIIKSCGLAQTKSRAIKSLSLALIEKFKGEVPDNLEALETLNGVGHKTASVVMIQAFNQPAFPVDTHIHRLAQRWKLTKGAHVAQTEADLKKIFPKEKWAKLHLQMIFFGRAFCPARGHVVENCPICSKIH